MTYSIYTYVHERSFEAFEAISKATFVPALISAYLWNPVAACTTHPLVTFKAMLAYPTQCTPILVMVREIHTYKARVFCAIHVDDYNYTYICILGIQRA